MRLKEDIKPVTYMKTRPAELLRKVSESRRPTIITQNGEAKAVAIRDIDRGTLQNPGPHASARSDRP